jgi:hypothetical protein
MSWHLIKLYLEPTPILSQLCFPSELNGGLGSTVPRIQGTSCSSGSAPGEGRDRGIHIAFTLSSQVLHIFLIGYLGGSSRQAVPANRRRIT